MIRLAQMRDVAAMCAIDEFGAHPARCDEIAQAVRASSGWIAEIDMSLAGYLVVDQRFFGFPFVWLLHVAAPYRRRGIGRRLLEHAMTMFPDSKVFTSTNTSNAPAQAFMEASGFERCGRVEHLDEGDPELFYVRLPSAGQSR